MRSSIRTNIYCVVTLLIVIPVLLLSLILSYVYAIKLEAVIVDSLHAVAVAQIAEMDNLCQLQKSNLEIIGAMELTQAALRGELDDKNLPMLDDMLYSRVQMTSYLNSIAVITADSQVVACSADNYDPMAEEGFTAICQGMGGEPFWISDMLTVKGYGDEHKAVVAIFRVEENNHVLGYVIAEIDLSFYDEIRQRTKLWNESTFYLLDGHGDIIIAGTSDEYRHEFVTTPKERQDYSQKYAAIDFAANPQGSFQYKAAGRTYVTYYSNTQYTNWRVMLSVNLDSYLEQRINYIVTASVLVVFCAVLALWIGRFTSKRIVLPIKQVTDTLERVQKSQDYSLRIDAERHDELGMLSVEINRLLELIETENMHQAQERFKLQKKAERDALTNVLNKEKIMHHLEEATQLCRSEGRSMAVMFVDVDDFRNFNSNYGHDVGDQVLAFIAALLEQELGGTVGRVGGDEFLVVVDLPHRLQVLESSLEKINIRTKSQFTIRSTGKQVPVTVCIGTVLADFSQPGSTEFTPELLTKWADKVMYRIKNSGKGGYIICHARDCLALEEKQDERS